MIHTFLQICPDEETNSGEYIFSKCNSWVDYYLNSYLFCDELLLLSFKSSAFVPAKNNALITVKINIRIK